MASTAVEVTIGLLAKDAASSVISGVTTKFQGLGTAAKAVTAAVAIAATAVTSVVGTLTALAVKSASAAGEVAKLKRETGLTAEEASKFKAIGDRLGLSVDDLSKSFGIFSKNVDNNAKSITDNHVAVVKAKDGHVDLDKTLIGLAERFKLMPDGVEKTSLAMELFGKSGKDMLPFLNQGKDGIKALGDEAARLGLVFDDKALAAAKRFSLSQKDLTENIEGLKNKIGLAFLPVLADASGALLGLATGVLPKVTAGFEIVVGWVHTAIDVGKEIFDVFTRKDPAAGGFLASLIGKKQAEDFMGLVNDIRIQWELLWIFQIRPAIEWGQKNIPLFWESFKEVVARVWGIIKPKLEDLVDKLEMLKKKFGELPPEMQTFALQTAVAVGVVKVTGLDEIISNWAQAMAGAAQTAGGLIGAIKGLGLAAVAAGALFLILVAAIAAVIFVGTHLQELSDAWNYFVDITRIIFAEWADFMIGIFNKVVTWVVEKINGIIDAVNLLISALNLIPGVNIPLISHIKVELPNADNVRKTLDDIARDRTSRVFVNVYEQAIAGGGGTRQYALGTPYVPFTGPAIVHQGERILTAEQNRSGNWGGPNEVIHTHVYLNGREIADAVGDTWNQDRRMQGLTA